MKRSMLIALLLSFALPVSAQHPTFTVETLTLDIPKVELIEGGVSQFFSVKMMATPDISSFNLVAADTVKAANDIDLAGVTGTYKGSMAVYAPGQSAISSSLSCPDFSFNPANTTVEVAVSGKQVTMSHDAFGGTVCNYSGTADGSNVVGTFQCNDFNQGNWKANVLSLNTLIGDSVSVHLSHTGDKCSFDTSFAGIRP